MTVNWCDLKAWDDDTLRFVADRNNPEHGDVVVVCTTTMDSSRKMARAVLAALGVDPGSTASFDSTRACWSQAQLRWTIWEPRRLTLVGAHRLHPIALRAAKRFADDVDCELNIVTAGPVHTALAVELSHGSTAMAPGTLLERIQATPVGIWQLDRHPADIHGMVADTFHHARRHAAQLLERLEASEITWFEPLDLAQTRLLVPIVDETAAVAEVRLAAALGVVAGAALQGWKWPDQISFIGQQARQPGHEHWARLDRYREPSHAAAVALAAHYLRPAECLVLAPGDVAGDGSAINRPWGPETVAAPAARRALATMARDNTQAARPPSQFLNAHGRPIGLIKLTDIVRRSVGVLGADLVT